MAEKETADAGKTKVSKNFLRQFRDKESREFKQISASQFMDVWNHYDSDPPSQDFVIVGHHRHYTKRDNGYIEDNELDGFLKELVTSVNTADIGPEGNIIKSLKVSCYYIEDSVFVVPCNWDSSMIRVISDSALKDAKKLVLNAFDDNNDGRIDIAELAQILPMEQNFLLLFRRDHPLASSVEFMKVWREYDADGSGYIEADELKNFLSDLLKKAEKDGEVNDEQLIIYADTMLQLFDRNRDGRLQISEMAKLLPVKENFLCRPVFKGCSRLNSDDIERVFSLYDVDKNGFIENDELHGFLKDLMELVEDDFDADDLLDCQKILLDKCDLNQDGKINKQELTMVLTSCKTSTEETQKYI